jgi:hypothetical protein
MFRRNVLKVFILKTDLYAKIFRRTYAPGAEKKTLATEKHEMGSRCEKGEDRVREFTN